MRSIVGGNNTAADVAAAGTVNGCIPSAHSDIKHIRFPNCGAGEEYVPGAAGEEGVLKERDRVPLNDVGRLLYLP